MPATRHIRCMALALCLWPLLVAAQPRAAAAASAPTATLVAPVVPAAPEPRRQTAAEVRENAALPGELRPENPVIPQISLPIGRTPAEPVRSSAELARQRRIAARGGIDDAVARCKAKATAEARAECQQALAREKPAR